MFRPALSLGLALVAASCFSLAQAQVRRVADLNTTEIRALDRTKTIVLLPGGILEEHGPYLPAYTDGVLSERLTDELARGIAAKKPGFTVLVFPQVPLGASGSNELGGHFSFPGTYAVRPSTLRAAFMDLGTELGEQGFRWIFVVHVHGAPLHNRALDQAGDYFHDVYGGRMIHLWGLIPVLGGWGSALQGLTDAQKKEEGVSLHAGMDETSLLLYLEPKLVSPLYKDAPIVTGATLAQAFDATKPASWPGYLGSPRQSSAALGETIWKSFAAAALDTSLKILDGVDPATFPRYADYLEKQPLYQEWIRAANERDAALEAKQRAWLEKQKK